MVEVRWMFFSVVLQFTAAAVTGQSFTSVITKAGDEVTLPCDNVIKNQDKCGQTSWLFSLSERKTEELIADGQIGQSAVAQAKSSRLSVTADCSLVIKNVIRQDVGRYTCRQFNKEGKKQGGDASVFLYLINIEEHQQNGMTFFYCSVVTHVGCKHTVQWRFEGHSDDVKTRSDSCSASVTYPTDMDQKSDILKSLMCVVTHISTKKMQQFDVNLKLLHENTGITTSERENTNQVPWRVIVVSVGLAALIITVVAVNIWMRTKGNNTRGSHCQHEDEDADEGTVTYENVGEPSASIRLH